MILLGCNRSFSSTFKMLVTGLFWLSTLVQLLIACEIASSQGNFIATCSGIRGKVTETRVINTVQELTGWL